jgi:hypothetical protein
MTTGAKHNKVALWRQSNGPNTLCKLSCGRRLVSCRILCTQLFITGILLKGCDHLASIEENIVTGFTDVSGDDNNRITVAVNSAYKVTSYVLYRSCAYTQSP